MRIQACVTGFTEIVKMCSIFWFCLSCSNNFFFWKSNKALTASQLLIRLLHSWYPRQETDIFLSKKTRLLRLTKFWNVNYFPVVATTIQLIQLLFVLRHKFAIILLTSRIRTKMHFQYNVCLESDQYRKLPAHTSIANLCNCNPLGIFHLQISNYNNSVIFTY